MHKIVNKIREFNRFYMSQMNLLGDHYLGSEYSVTQARIFFEIYENEGCTATHIARTMNIDKSYLSRIIKNHKKNGYIIRNSSANDGRAFCLFLTDKGKELAENFIKKSNEEIKKLTQDLSENEKNQLEKAFDTIIKILENAKNLKTQELKNENSAL